MFSTTQTTPLLAGAGTDLFEASDWSLGLTLLLFAFSFFLFFGGFFPRETEGFEKRNSGKRLWEPFLLTMRCCDTSYPPSSEELILGKGTEPT